MKILSLILIEYIFLAILSYTLLVKLELKFENKQNKNLEPSERDKKIILILISILWIIYLPKIILDTEKERNKK